MKTITVGKYKGTFWKALPICDVFPHMRIKTVYVFECDEDQNPFGDYYATLKEFQNHIDKQSRMKAEIDAMDITKEESVKALFDIKEEFREGHDNDWTQIETRIMEILIECGIIDLQED